MALSVFLASAVGATTASANSFGVGGPFDSAHQPRPIQSGDISIPDPGDPDSFAIGIGFNVGCPSGVATPLTVTFTDLTGTITDTLSDPCSGTWSGSGSNLGSADNDLSTVQNNGCPPATCGTQSAQLLADDEFEPAWDTGAHPFLYQVTGPKGILARGAFTGNINDNDAISYAKGWPAPQPPFLPAALPLPCPRQASRAAALATSRHKRPLLAHVVQQPDMPRHRDHQQERVGRHRDSFDTRRLTPGHHPPEGSQADRLRRERGLHGAPRPPEPDLHRVRGRGTSLPPA